MDCVIGADLGSRMVKFAITNEEGGAVFYKCDTGEFYRRLVKKEGEKICVDIDKLHHVFKGMPDMSDGGPSIIATGYGRNCVNLSADRIVSEISAHAQGAVIQTGLDDFTLLDMGGQDTKVILVRNGAVCDFTMNDRCAAGSGRYIENMARILTMSIDEISSYANDPLPLTSTCATFGESEVLGLLSEGQAPEKIAAGVNMAVFRLLEPNLNRFKSEVLVITGGVAKNGALMNIIRYKADFHVVIPEFPQYNGAIGCTTFYGN